MSKNLRGLWFYLLIKVQNATSLGFFDIKQAWKLSAIKGEPNLSILWEVRQIHLKKAFFNWKATSNLTKLFLDKKQFLQKSHYCQKSISGQKVWSSLTKFKFRQTWSKKIQNKTAIVIIFVNVATFYSTIFWLVRNPIW